MVHEIGGCVCYTFNFDNAVYFFFLEELAMLLTHQQKENRLLCIKMKEFLYSFIVLLLTNKKKE